MKNLFLILAAQFSRRLGKASPCPPIAVPRWQIKPAHPEFFLLFTLFILSSALILPASAQAATDITTGLVARYPFNGNANDVSGNGHDGTVNGATLSTDRFGNANGAYSFDGASNTISLANTSQYNLAEPFTVSAWAKYGAGGEGILVGKHVCATPGGFALALDAASNPFFMFSSFIVSPTAYNDNNWHNFTGIYDGSTATLYVDGNPVAYLSSPTAINTNTNVIIGNVSGDPNRGCAYFNGSIDDVRLYNRALSTTEVQALYNEANPVTTYTLSLTKSGTGTGTVSPNTGTITWASNSGSATFTSGTSVTLTATPNSGSTFSGWSGACSGTGSCQITMDAAKNVSAIFMSPLIGGSIQGTTINVEPALVSTFAGAAGIAGSTDGTGAAARFNQPGGVTTDGNNLYTQLSQRQIYL